MRQHAQEVTLTIQELQQILKTLNLLLTNLCHPRIDPTTLTSRIRAALLRRISHLRNLQSVREQQHPPQDPPRL